jgi:hypothetical protein
MERRNGENSVNLTCDRNNCRRRLAEALKERSDAKEYRKITISTVGCISL